jgi:sulfur-oxidizing protein SoxX
MVREHHHRNVRLTAAVLLTISTGAALAQAPVLPDPLTAEPGDPARGKAVAVNSDLGNCVICHHIPVPELPEGAAGDIGPDLAGVGSRLTAPELRQRVVNAKAIDPDTVMPAYFVADGLYRVQARYAGKPILTAQQVEDLVAYLLTLK